MIGVPVQLCRDYYGLDASNCDFGLWLLAISEYVFTKIGKDEVARTAARAATDNLIAVVAAAIGRAKAGHAANTIVRHFVTQQEAACARGDSALPADALLSTIVAMTAGYRRYGGEPAQVADLDFRLHHSRGGRADVHQDRGKQPRSSWIRRRHRGHVDQPATVYGLCAVWN